jgi:hypothetical protein
MTVETFLERRFDEPLRPSRVLDAGREAQWCFDLHRVRWNGSFLALDGRSMICAFSTPDMESARLAMRDPRTDLSRFWPGTLHVATPGIVPTVVVERTFAAPVRYEDLKALGEAKAWCMNAYNAKHAHTAFSLDRKRMLCFYSAPDAEAVRSVQRESGAPFDTIWAGISIAPGQHSA